jgi:hypothetical protein
MSGTMCLGVGWQFDSITADLYMDKYSHIPDGNDVKKHIATTQGSPWS